jgi:hypothetical protein
MSVLVEDGLDEAVLCQGAVKKHTNGQDSAGRFWQAARTNSSNPNLQLYVSDDKFATWDKHGLANLNVSGGSSPSDVEPLPIEFACFVDSQDFIHLYWVQANNNADLDAGDLYHLYGKINSATSITWQPIRKLVNVTADTLSLGDMVAFVPSDDTAVMQCAFVYSRGTSGGEELRFHRTKFTIASPGTYTDQADSLLDTNAVNPDRLRPVMTFRQASPHNEKTPHASSPHLYVVVSNERFKVEYYFGSYGFTSGNAFWTWSHGNISSVRWVQGTASGVSLWHIVLWDGTNPVWFAQAVGSNGIDPILMYQRLSATSAAVLTDPEDANTQVSKHYSGGNAWIDRTNNRLYFAGCDNLTDHDLDYGYVNMNTGGFNFEQGEFEDQGVGNDPKLAVNRDGEFGYFMLLWDRETSSLGHHVRAEPDIVLQNHTPATPTVLAVNPSIGTDTTPEFQCNVSDVDIIEQIKARFTVYQNDGTTVVGTTDSNFRTGNGQVTKTYPTPLATGTYKVAAAAVDDSGAISGQTAQVTFSVLGTFSADTDLLSNVAEFFSADTDLIIDIENTATVDIDLLVDVTVHNSADVDLILDIDTGWVPVDDTPIDSIWSEVDASL